MNTTTLISIRMLESINSELKAQVAELSTPTRRSAWKSHHLIGTAISLLLFLSPFQMLRF